MWNLFQLSGFVFIVRQNRCDRHNWHCEFNDWSNFGGLPFLENNLAVLSVPGIPHGLWGSYNALPHFGNKPAVLMRTGHSS